MAKERIRQVTVVGAGTMGHGIAQVFAQAGAEVVLADTTDEFLARGMGRIRRNLERLVKKGALDEAAAAAVAARVRPVTALREAAAAADLIVEAVPERRETKREVFRELDRFAPSHTLLASNTSSISITEIASWTYRPGHVVGMHFMNPVPVMKLVEVILGLETSPETEEAVVEAARWLGKVPVVVQDSPGFVSNRVLMPLVNEAICCLMEGVGTRDGIDEIMKLGMNHPMGPLELADFIGLDVCLQIMEVLHQGFGDDKYRPCPLLRRMVAAGHLGRKSGRGFYVWEDGRKTG